MTVASTMMMMMMMTDSVTSRNVNVPAYSCGVMRTARKRNRTTCRLLENELITQTEWKYWRNGLNTLLHIGRLLHRFYRLRNRFVIVFAWYTTHIRRLSVSFMILSFLQLELCSLVEMTIPSARVYVAATHWYPACMIVSCMLDHFHLLFARIQHKLCKLFRTTTSE